MTTINSLAIAASEASPRLKQNQRIDGAVIKVNRESITVLGATGGHASGDVYEIFPIRSNAVVHGLSVVWRTAITSLSDVDIGLYTNTPGGNPVAVDATLFVEALTMAIAGATESSAQRADYGVDMSLWLQPLWQILGLTEDPHINYSVCMTLNATPATDEEVAFILLYTL